LFFYQSKLVEYLVQEWADKKRFESMGGHMNTEEMTREFFQFAKDDVIMVSKVEVPMQQNFHDCGLFILEYMACFLKCFFSRKESSALSRLMRYSSGQGLKDRNKGVSKIVSATMNSFLCH
jgi:hypothetical protein